MSKEFTLGKTKLASALSQKIVAADSDDWCSPLAKSSIGEWWDVGKGRVVCVEVQI